MAQSQSGNLFAPAKQVRIVADKERRNPVLDSGRQGCFDLMLGAGADNNSLQPEAARRCLYRLDIDLRSAGVVRIDKQRDLRGVRKDFTQQFQALWSKLGPE